MIKLLSFCEIVVARFDEHIACFAAGVPAGRSQEEEEHHLQLSHLHRPHRPLTRRRVIRRKAQVPL